MPQKTLFQSVDCLSCFNVRYCAFNQSKLWAGYRCYIFQINKCSSIAYDITRSQCHDITRDFYMVFQLAYVLFTWFNQLPEHLHLYMLVMLPDASFMLWACSWGLQRFVWITLNQKKQKRNRTFHIIHVRFVQVGDMSEIIRTHQNSWDFEHLLYTCCRWFFDNFSLLVC